MWPVNTFFFWMGPLPQKAPHHWLSPSGWSSTRLSWCMHANKTARGRQWCPPVKLVKTGACIRGSSGAWIGNVPPKVTHVLMTALKMEKHKSWHDYINCLKPSELYSPLALTFVKCILTTKNNYVFCTISLNTTNHVVSVRYKMKFYVRL